MTLPSALIQLSFGDDFNQSLEDMIWPNLHTLILGAEYNLPLRNVQLPKTLETLTFGNLFNQSLAPRRKKKSKKWRNCWRTHMSWFLANRVCWNLSQFFGGTLQYLLISCRVLAVFMFFHCNHIVKLASWLLWHVRFNSNSKVDVTFPESLQTLTFGDDFDQSLTGVQLPESLRSLTFGGDFNQRLLGTKSLCCKGSALRTSEPTKAS